MSRNRDLNVEYIRSFSQDTLKLMSTESNVKFIMFIIHGRTFFVRSSRSYDFHHQLFSLRLYLGNISIIALNIIRVHISW